MTGPPGARPALLDLAHLICKRSSLLLCGIVSSSTTAVGVNNSRSLELQKAYGYLRRHKIRGFCALVDPGDAGGLQRGTAALLQASGLGKMRPNIVLLGFKNDWRFCDRNALDQYFKTIQ